MFFLFFFILFLHRTSCSDCFWGGVLRRLTHANFLPCERLPRLHRTQIRWLPSRRQLSSWWPLPPARWLPSRRQIRRLRTRAPRWLHHVVQLSSWWPLLRNLHCLHFLFSFPQMNVIRATSSSQVAPSMTFSMMPSKHPNLRKSPDPVLPPRQHHRFARRIASMTSSKMHRIWRRCTRRLRWTTHTMA